MLDVAASNNSRYIVLPRMGAGGVSPQYGVAESRRLAARGRTLALPPPGRSGTIKNAGRPSVTAKRTALSSPCAPLSLPAFHPTVSPSLHLGHFKLPLGAVPPSN
jgi:hypothetical protein